MTSVLYCDHCGRRITGRATWVRVEWIERGDRKDWRHPDIVRFGTPSLCEGCADGVATTLRDLFPILTVDPQAPERIEHA
jgi:hypothetical protein